MISKVLVVVDMINDFLHPEGVLYCGEKARGIIGPVSGLIDTFRLKSLPVIYVCDAHEEDDKEFDRFPPHAVKNSWGGRVVEELRPFQKDIWIFKTRFSAFFKTDMEDILEKLSPQEVWVVGVCTSICVMDTVADLINRNYKVVVPVNCVADFDEAMHECALKRMRQIYGVTLFEEDI